MLEKPIVAGMWCPLLLKQVDVATTNSVNSYAKI
jgi:hypothetical protein